MLQNYDDTTRRTVWVLSWLSHRHSLTHTYTHTVNWSNFFPLTHDILWGTPTFSEVWLEALCFSKLSKSWISLGRTSLILCSFRGVLPFGLPTFRALCWAPLDKAVAGRWRDPGRTGGRRDGLLWGQSPAGIDLVAGMAAPVPRTSTGSRSHLPEDTESKKEVRWLYSEWSDG